jgi:DNA (cytosine-5)-methyltransferase 1
MIQAVRPRIIVFDNVKGLLGTRFDAYRSQMLLGLSRLGYESSFRLVNAADFGVPQSRPIVIMVGVRDVSLSSFRWPEPCTHASITVGETLHALMSSRGWHGADQWRHRADSIAPAIVGGSRKHGGPDLGPSRTKKAWEQLGVNGLSLANDAPGPNFTGSPRLTLQMVAALQGFPNDWRFCGGKTDVYRQIAQALPPSVSRAIALALQPLL